MAKGDMARGVGQGSMGNDSGIGGPNRPFKPGMGMNPNPGNTPFGSSLMPPGQIGNNNSNSMWQKIIEMLGSQGFQSLLGGGPNRMTGGYTGRMPSFNMGMPSNAPNPVRFGNPASGGLLPFLPNPSSIQNNPNISDGYTRNPNGTMTGGIGGVTYDPNGGLGSMIRQQIPRPTLPQAQPQGVPLNDTLPDSRFRNLNNGGSMMGSYRPY